MGGYACFFSGGGSRVVTSTASTKGAAWSVGGRNHSANS